MEKQSHIPSEEPGMSRRDALRVLIGAGAALTLGCVPQSAYAQKTDKFKQHIDFNDLPKNPEYVYLLLFENNPNDRNTSDDFIADAERVMGYDAPNYWHSEIAYFDQRTEQWMAIGCRPPKCSSDFPVDQLQRNLRGYTVAVRQLHVPMDQQVEARKWFETNLQGQPYNLAGPRSTNCTDAVVELGRHGRIKEVQGLRAKTRDEIKKRPGISGFLGRWNLSSVDDVMHRDSIVFPDELEKAGKFIGTMQF